MAAGRVLATLASAAGITLAGLLVRHRGALAALVACGVLAVYPDSVAAAHTVLVEPWLVLCCLAGGLAVFDGDRITASTRRLAWGGAAFGVAGAVESWAILPVLVLLVLARGSDPPGTPRGADGAWPASRQAPSRVLAWMAPGAGWRRAGGFVGGVAAGFAVPVLPFAALAPGRCYDSLIVAQVGPRAGMSRVPVLARLQEMAGLSYARFPLRLGTIYLPGHTAIVITAALLVLCTAGAAALVPLARWASPAPLARWASPAPLDWFAVVTLMLVVAVFLWPSQFHYHFCAFLAPVLGLAIALPLASLARGSAPLEPPGAPPASPFPLHSPGRQAGRPHRAC